MSKYPFVSLIAIGVSLTDDDSIEGLIELSNRVEDAYNMGWAVEGVDDIMDTMTKDIAFVMDENEYITVVGSKTRLQQCNEGYIDLSLFDPETALIMARDIINDLYAWANNQRITSIYSLARYDKIDLR